MNKEELKAVIQSYIPEAEVKTDSQYPEVTVSKDRLLDLARFLKDSKETSFDYLFSETAIDFQDHFMMVYHLDSTQHRHERDNPEIDSVCEVWIGAEYHEREVFDLFGIRFKNHPDLRKIFLENDWVGYPMRKDYEDPINIVER